MNANFYFTRGGTAWPLLKPESRVLRQFWPRMKER